MNSTDFVFLLSAFIAVLSAAAIVTRKNPVYSVVCMLPFFLSMTTLFVMLSASFLAAIQMIVYGGAILVVFLFVIMLINLKPEELRDDFSAWSYGLSAGSMGLLLWVLYKFIDGGTRPELQAGFAQEVALRPHNAVFGSIESVAYPMFEKQLVPFELASILIIVATLGAVLLTKKRV